MEAVIVAGVGIVVLGLWLFLSAFLWPHTSVQFTNALLVAFLLVGGGVLCLQRVPRARHATAGIAAWLIVSSLVLPDLTPATRVNDMVVGVGVSLLAIAPGLSTGWRRMRPART
jgi:hypothetical protein